MLQKDSPTRLHIKSKLTAKLAGFLHRGYDRFMFRIFLLAGITLFTIGCAPSVPATGIATTSTPSMTAPVSEVQTTPSTPNNKDAMPVPSDPALQGSIEKAKDDLAQRLSISATNINLVEAAEAEWSDSSLGCPQAGMEYLQVITPGYLIVLEAGGNQYEYHTNRDTYVIYCENTIPPSLPKP